MKGSILAAGLYVVLSVLLQTEAVATSLTGAQLFSDPNASFPTRTPVIDGSALRFEGGGNGLFEEILVYPLLAPGTGATEFHFSFALNMTRLACDDQNFGCAGGTVDHDVNAGIVIGNRALTANYSDGTPSFNGVIGSAFWHFAGNWGLNSALSEVLDTNTGFPLIGETYDAQASFWLTPSSTEISILFLGQTYTKLYGFGLDLSGGVNFAMFKDNDNGEQYQINTFAFRTVPEPITITLVAAGLAGVCRSMRRKAY